MAQNPATVQPLSNLTDSNNADQHATVSAGLPENDSQHVLQLLEAMETRLRQDMHNIKEELNQKIDDMKEELKLEIRSATRTALRAANGSRSEGALIEYEIVPFMDGTMPPAHLPRLIKLTSIDNLSGVQAAEYLRGYGIHNYEGDLASKRRKVAELVGVSADVVRLRFG